MVEYASFQVWCDFAQDWANVRIWDGVGFCANCGATDHEHN